MRPLQPVIILFIALSACFSTVTAQQCVGGNTPVNEIGVRLGSVTNSSGVGGINIAERSSHMGAFNGIHYKRYGTFGAFRTSLGLTQYEYENRRNCPNCIRTDGDVRGAKLRLGYEWFAFLGQLEPFVAVDAVFAYGRYRGETWSSDLDNYQESTDNRSRRGFGNQSISWFAIVPGICNFCICRNQPGSDVLWPPNDHLTDQPGSINHQPKRQLLGDDIPSGQLVFTQRPFLGKNLGVLRDHHFKTLRAKRFPPA